MTVTAARIDRALDTLASVIADDDAPAARRDAAAVIFQRLEIEHDKARDREASITRAITRAHHQETRHE